MARPLQPLAGRLSRPAVNRAKRLISLPVARNLDVLGVIWGTDKARSQHAYTPHYARHLKRRRRQIQAVLEIGIGGYDWADGGNSLLMWRSYFPNATIYGLDIHEKRIDEPRIVTLQGDQSDPDSLLAAVQGCPPFDLIVDDGSHIGSHIITTFETLLPLLKPGGLYAIEDMETAYWPDHGGGPPGTPGTSVSLVKGLLDDVNRGGRVAEVHCYHQLAIITKR
jgi:demethylmacrocin O-methyltransferase